MEESNDRINLNIGGKLFETTATTLQSAGPESLLAALSIPAASNPSTFVDRDPELFSVLLTLLRSGRLPSSARQFHTQDLVDEALYYGIESRIRSALAPPPLLGFDATLSTTIVPASDAVPTAHCAGTDGSIWIAHSGQISAYGWNLTHAGTVRTHLEEISSLRRAWPEELAAIGSLDYPGLHFYDVSGACHVGTVHWSDPSDPRIYKARVTAIAGGDSRSDPLFASFECLHRENCILAVDRETLQPVSEIGRQSGGAAKSAAPGKVVHVPGLGLLFVVSVSSGAFGYSGYMRLWDPRSGEAVWETSEPGGTGRSSRFGDSFADADVDGKEGLIYKVCWKSGDVGVADLRRLGEGFDPWVYLEERSPALRSAGGGENSVLRCYKGQVFVSRATGLEVWSKLDDEQGEEERRYRRNFVDTEEDAKLGLIRRMEGGGDRLFVSREGVEGIQVWESSELSGTISLL
ncbi:protein ENDOPLASMIC RETICULUM-ARRESTED PEN3 [Typha latifolia]|uniref:protein ENDOPLASMIC RETICULUM-ARRESTED PEN3 n=1 Tax=Typha latifolia TaxID=4733 RepID=UPI003C2C0563